RNAAICRLMQEDVAAVHLEQIMNLSRRNVKVHAERRSQNRVWRAYTAKLVLGYRTSGMRAIKRDALRLNKLIYACGDDVVGKPTAANSGHEMETWTGASGDISADNALFTIKGAD